MAREVSLPGTRWSVLVARYVHCTGLLLKICSQNRWKSGAKTHFLSGKVAIYVVAYIHVQCVWFFVASVKSGVALSCVN